MDASAYRMLLFIGSSLGLTLIIAYPGFIWTVIIIVSFIYLVSQVHAWLE